MAPALIQASMIVPPQLLWIRPTGTFRRSCSLRPKYQAMAEKLRTVSGEEGCQPPKSAAKSSRSDIPVARLTWSRRRSG